jgi:glutathione S-transferase
LASELGLAPSLELLQTPLRTEDPEFWADNPLAKVPVWITDDGLRLHDSNVICAYLDEVHGGGRHLAARGPARWRDLTLISVADGVAEAGMLARHELARPQAGQNAQRVAEEMAKVVRGLDHFSSELESTDPGEKPFGLASIAVACSLGWVELRFGRDFIVGGRESLDRWWTAAGRRDSLVQTRPDAA